MAETAIEVVTLETMRRELRISADDQSQDARITEKIGEAVDFVSERTGLPLLDVTETLYECPYGVDYSILPLRVRDVLSITEIKYWETTQKLREDPTGEVEVDTLGRLFATCEDESLGFFVYPPADGWPTRLANSLFQVKVVRGLETIAPGIKSAVILATRQLFEGFREVRPTNAMFTFMAPHVRY